MKNIKGILILLIAITSALLVYMVFFVEPIHEYTYEEYRISQEGENPELEAELKVRIYPVNKKILEEKYNGNLDLNYMYEKLHQLVHKNLPILQEELQDVNASGLNTYFETNRSNLLAVAGITNVEGLSKLVQNIVNKEIAETEYIDSEILTDTYVEDERYDMVNIKLNYKNSSLYFKIYIANDMLTSPMIIFDSINGGKE